jgi:CRISPR-associated protein Cmr1
MKSILSPQKLGGFEMQLLKVKLRTLTPIWTGDVDKNSGVIKETSLIGSLRWWFEGLVRGFGGFVCEPIEGKGCKLDSFKNLDEICNACEYFGCTGWSRRFRMTSTALNNLPLFFVTNRNMYTLTGNWLMRIFNGKKETRPTYGGRQETFFKFENDTLWSNDFVLSFSSTDVRTYEKTKNLISFLLYFISKFGALGAKVQNGFGQVEIIDGLEKETVNKGLELIKHMRGNKQRNGKFDISRFFCSEYEISNIRMYDNNFSLIGIQPQGFNFKNYFIPCAFDIRYKSSAKNPRTGMGKDFGMRPWFNDHFGREITKKLLGETRPIKDEDRSASRINVSHLYRKEPRGNFLLKIWGFVPEDLDSGAISVSKVENTINNFITGQTGLFPGSRVISRFDAGKELGL